MKIELGKPDMSWSQYDLSTTPILVNGHDFGKTLVARGETPIAIVGDQYTLLPNEEAVKVADELAEQAGLVKFTDFSGPWIIPMRGHPHATYHGENNAKVHAMYALNESYKVDGDKMFVGVSVSNAIDGSRAFGAGIFTFRQACRNMVLLAGKKGWEFSHGRMDHGKTLEAMSKRHTKSLEVGTRNFNAIIADAMDKAVGIVDKYKELTRIQVNLELLEKIKKSRLPKSIVSEFMKDEEAAKAVDISSLTQWNLYNDLTATIWHNPKTGIHTKEFLFGQLHGVMIPEARI